MNGLGLGNAPVGAVGMANQQNQQQMLLELMAQLGGGAGQQRTVARAVPGQRSVFGQQWGCCPPLFDECVDDEIMTLFQGLDAVEPAMRWLGMRRADKKYVKRAYLTYAAPAGASLGTPNDGLPDTICGGGQKVEIGKPCYIDFCGFGEIRLQSHELKDGGNDIAWCNERDVYTVDFGQGSQRIDNDEEWWLSVLSSQMMEHMATRMLVGDSSSMYNSTTVPNDSDGLMKLLTANYDCVGNPSVLDWANNPVCDYTADTGMEGITLNGDPVTGKRYGSNLYVTLRQIFRQNLRKFRMTRMLSGTRELQYGDVALLMPDWLIECLIECGICHVICNDDMTRRDSEISSMKYTEWMTGGEGYGVIPFDNFLVPILPYNPVDWSSYNPETGGGMRGRMENEDGTANIMMLWRGMGGNNGRRFLIPEYNDLSDGNKDTANNGQVQLWMDECGRCYTLNMATEWRMYNDFPCVQTLITNVSCDAKFEICHYPTNIEPLDPNCDLIES